MHDRFRKEYSQKQPQIAKKKARKSLTDFAKILNIFNSIIFQACVCYLLNSPSKQAMHDRFRKEFEYVWPKDFVLYYRQRLLPRSGRLGRYENSQKQPENAKLTFKPKFSSNISFRWALAKLNICENSFLSPHANPQDRFFKLVNGFRHWETLSLEQIIRHSELELQIPFNKLF